jgi:flagellin-like protein
MINFNKKGISPVIATILLLAITVIIAVGVYQFLSSYTQDTYDSIQGDQTLSLQFGGKVTLYDAGGPQMNIASIDFEQDSYNFSSVIFTPRGGSNIECNEAELQVNKSTSNTYDLSTYCTAGEISNFSQGTTYDILMVGDSAVEVSGVRYR